MPTSTRPRPTSPGSNGVWVANGNLAIRHLGIPTVTVPMGVMADIGMPVGLTFAGRAYDDAKLLGLAAAFDVTGPYRQAPSRTPEIALDLARPIIPASGGQLGLRVEIEPVDGDRERLRIAGESASALRSLTVNGESVEVQRTATGFAAGAVVAINRHRHSEWSLPWGHIVIALAEDGCAAFVEMPAS